MEPFAWLVVFALTVAAVGSSPLINKLQPGEEWPTRNSVLQPQDAYPLLEQNATSPLDAATTVTDAKLSVTEIPTKGINVETPLKDNNEVNSLKPSEVKPLETPKEETNEVTSLKQPDGKPIENPTKEYKEENSLKPFEEKPIEDNKVNSLKISEAKLIENNDVNSLKISEDIEVKVDYSGAQVWKVPTTSSEVRRLLGNLRHYNLISSWGGNQSHIDLLVKPDALKNVSQAFEKQNVPFDVIIHDLQKRINEENPPLDINDIELQDRQGHRMTWKQYHRLADIHGFLDYLAKTYPRIVSVKTIGKSYQGRDLKVLRISNGNPTNKAVFVDGGIHAREWISPATVTYFINQVAENFYDESDDIKNIDWYFLPVVNPDGYEYTHLVDRLWRKNRRPSGTRQCIGTDLNRNFGHHWGGKGSSGNVCSEIYRGPQAFSEPESKALSDFIVSSAANFQAYLTYHSYGQYLLYPWGYDDALPPDYKDLDVVGKNIAQEIQRVGGSKYTVGSSSGVLYPASGGSDDWAKAQGIKYSYTVELSDTGRYGFILPTSFIEPVAKESFAGVKILAKRLNSSD